MIFYFLQNIIIILQGKCMKSIQTLFWRKLIIWPSLMVQCKKHTLFTWKLGISKKYSKCIRGLL